MNDPVAMIGPPAIAPRLRRLFAHLGPFIVLIVLMVSLRLYLGETYWSHYNLQNILTQTVIVATAAIGMTLIIVSGGIDLSCGSVVAFTSMVTAIVASQRCGPGTAVFLAVASGAAIGALNGGLMVGGRLAPFIVTLGMMGIARGATKRLSVEKVSLPQSWISELMTKPLPPQHWYDYLAFAPSVWIVIGLVVLMTATTRLTVFGRHIYAVGSNEAAARLCGIRVGATKIAIYALAGATFGLAGVFQCARIDCGEPTVAMGLELDVIAAVIVGGASLSGGSGTVMGSIIGAVLMTVLRNGSQQLHRPNSEQEIIIGAAIVIAAVIDRLRMRRT